MRTLSLGPFPHQNTDFLDVNQLTELKEFLISQKDVNADQYPAFLKTSIEPLIRSLQSAQGVDNYRVLCSDTLCIWVLRSSQLCVKSKQWAATNEKIFFNDDNTATFIFRYVVDYCNETGGPLSNSLKDLFTKFLTLIRRYDPQEVLQSWADITLSISHERRVQFYLVEYLSKAIKQNDYFLQKDPNFISETIQLMSSNALANPIAKAICSILKRVYVDEDHAQQWVSNYWGPIKERLSNPQLRKPIEQYILPNLFKISKVAFNFFVKDLHDDTDVFISCLNIGQILAIEEEPFPVLVSYDTIQSLLVQDEFKIKTFQLITYSPKGSKPINPIIYEILKKNLDIFVTDCEVETRNEFTSMLKQFIFRVKDSAYALNRDGVKLEKKGLVPESEIRLKEVEAAKDFLKWLIDFSKCQIKPGAQYQRINTGFKILHYLVNSGLDSRIKVKLDIYYPFSIEIFDEVLKRLLFDNILSTYDDLRKSAVSLLVEFKVELPLKEHTDLVSKAFSMLDEYTTVDSGSKIVECLYKLNQNDELLDMLIERIPLNSHIKTAVCSPVDGYFQSIGLILDQKKAYDNSEKVITLVETNWSTVREILSHDSPEGCDQYGVGSAQLVLSYAWRSTKESTILLQKLLDFNLSDAQILRIGELVLDQLSTVRHRGAFSAVYPTFIKVATICKKRLPDQNKFWLDFNISLIQTKTQLITRRSGGLPFLITAIVTVERDLLRYAFDKLMTIAKIPITEGDESEKMDIPQVHAFNCIKTLFIESQLSGSVPPLIFEALDLALSTFSSKIWSVRNCSIMLFTALQNRLFGRKKLSARVFFSRFAGIDSLLADILKASIGDNKLETLFPVLTILSKLEANAGYDGLDKFKPLLRVCLATKYWKIREAAARTFPSLIAEREAESLSLFSSCSLEDQNKLHGHLLAIKALESFSESLAAAVYLKVDDLLVNSKCHSTRMVFTQILSSLLIQYPNEEVVEKVGLLFHNMNSDYEIDGSKQLLLKELFNIVKDDEVLLEEALNSPFFEVQSDAIQYCASSNITHPLLSRIANDDGCWNFVRSKAIPLVEYYSIEKAFKFVENQKDYGEDIKRSSMELLGSVAATTNEAQVYQSWYSLIMKNNDDDEPYQIRFSALKSVLRFLRVKETPEVSWLWYNFLSDDDDEIRELAASFFDDNSVTWYNAKRFSMTFGNCPKSAQVVLKQCLTFNPTFVPFYGNDKVLFKLEKKNFYRNRCELHEQLAQMIQNSKSNLSENEYNEIISHFIGLRQELESLVLKKGYDGILGWSSEEEVFEDIYSVLYHLKSLDLLTPELLRAAKEVNLHNYLIELLA